MAERLTQMNMISSCCWLAVIIEANKHTRNQSASFQPYWRLAGMSEQCTAKRKANISRWPASHEKYTTRERATSERASVRVKTVWSTENLNGKCVLRSLHVRVWVREQRRRLAQMHAYQYLRLGLLVCVWFPPAKPYFDTHLTFICFFKCYDFRSRRNWFYSLFKSGSTSHWLRHWKHTRSIAV